MTSNTDKIDWKVINRAMKDSTLNKKWFIVKHVSGMCGVGKFMVRWKERETAACPRCGKHEDATHVWQCQDEEATLTWNKSLANLYQWMVSTKMDPDITAAIIE